jgi:L-malate glycosyltransferase
MRSAHVVGSKTLGGAERFYLRLLEALHQRGETVLAFLRRSSEVVGQVPAGISVVQTPMRTVWDPFSRLALGHALKSAAPDIVQTYMGRATRLTHLGRGPGRPVHIARLGGYYKLDGYRHAHAWVGNTKGVCDYMIREGLPAERVFHIYNFIDLPAPPTQTPSEIRAAWGLPEEAWVLATAGRFVPVKGLPHLLAAFGRLPAELAGRPLWLLLVGDGPLAPDLRAQARGLGIDRRMVWTGWQTEPGTFYQAADLVVFPSLEAETLGNVILEAWAHRRPLVTASFRGAREITRHGEDAWCVPCGDDAALAEGIRTVLTDGDLARQLAVAGHERVQREFGRGAIVDRYLELYRTLLGG